MAGSVKLLTPSGGSVTIDATDTASALSLTLPATNDNIITANTTQTLTNKTLTNPVINGFTGDTSAITIGTTQFVKDASGNLGIGTASPATKLHIGAQGSVGSSAATVIYQGDYSTSSQLRYVINNAGSYYLGLGIDSSNNFVIGTSSSPTGTSPTAIATLTQAGNLGIGTSSPGSLIEVRPVNGGAAGQIRIGDYTSAAASTVTIIESFGARYDGNTTFGGKFGSAYRRCDGTAIASGTSLGYYAFGGQWGTDTSYQSTKLLYAASIVGVAEGSFTSASAMPTGISFSTGSTGQALTGVNNSYGTERARITSAGDLLVGDTAFSYGYNGRLFARNDVNTTPVAATINKIASGNVYGIINSFLSNGNNTASYHFSGVTQGVNQWYLYGNGTSSFTSDERKKKNIETTRNGYLEDLCKLRVVKYNWWTDDDGTPKELGLIAQEVEQIFPGLITNAIHPDVDGETYKVMKGSVIPFMLLKAIQELSAQNKSLEDRLAKLEAK